MFKVRSTIVSLAILLVSASHASRLSAQPSVPFLQRQLRQIQQSLEPHRPVTPTQARYPVPGQSSRYPLFTRYSPAQIREFNQIFQFGKLDLQQVLRLRSHLSQAAQAGDVIAQYYTAKTYDLYEFGRGNPQDGAIALQWYLKAAQQNFAEAEEFLFNVFLYRFMQVEQDKEKAVFWLRRALNHSDNKRASEIMLQIARFYRPSHSPSEQIPGFEASQEKVISSLQKALELDPDNATAIDWLSSIRLEQKNYGAAVALMERSTNPKVWEQLGNLYDRGIGVPQNTAKAVQWYLQAARQGIKLSQNDGVETLNETRSDIGFIHDVPAMAQLFKLVCQKRVAPVALGDLYTRERYQSFLRWQVKCELGAG